jgi:hypothetical protein
MPGEDNNGEFPATEEGRTRRDGEGEWELVEDENDDWDTDADNDGVVEEDGIIRWGGDGDGRADWGSPNATRTRWTSEGEGMRVLRYRATGVMTCAERE